VYLLYSEVKDRFYIGHTNQIEDRLERHNCGEVKSTKAHRPWVMVYVEQFVSRGEAMKREKELKSWKKKSRLERLISS